MNIHDKTIDIIDVFQHFRSDDTIVFSNMLKILTELFQCHCTKEKTMCNSSTVSMGEENRPCSYFKFDCNDGSAWYCAVEIFSFTASIPKTDAPSRAKG